MRHEGPADSLLVWSLAGNRTIGYLSTRGRSLRLPLLAFRAPALAPTLRTGSVVSDPQQGRGGREAVIYMPKQVVKSSGVTELLRSGEVEARRRKVLYIPMMAEGLQ